MKKRKTLKIDQKPNAEGLFKKIIAGALKIAPKQVFISAAKKPFTWTAKVYVKSHVTPQLLHHVAGILHKNEIQLLDGSSASTFGSGITDAKSSLELSFKWIKRFKTPTKPSRFKTQAEVQMNKTEILAASLGQGLKLNNAMRQLDIMLKADDMGNFKVLKYGDSARDGMEAFKKYISERDYSNFLGFMKAYDDLLYKFRGNQEINLDEIDDDEDEAPRGRGKKKGGKSFAVKPKRSVAPKTDFQEGGEEGVKDEPSVVISDLKMSVIKDALRAKAFEGARRYMQS